jgi:hypothetical protein
LLSLQSTFCLHLQRSPALQMRVEKQTQKHANLPLSKRLSPPLCLALSSVAAVKKAQQEQDNGNPRAVRLLATTTTTTRGQRIRV